MIFTDSILTPLIVIGVFVYFALKSPLDPLRGKDNKQENDHLPVL